MKEHFVNYNQSLALKELDFDETSFAGYELIENGELWIGNIGGSEQFNRDYYIPAPLKSQVLKWFRDEHNLYAEINLDSYKEPYSLKVTIKKMDATNTYVEKEFYPYDNGIGDIDNDKYEEAESACIDKLIELIKEKKS